MSPRADFDGVHDADSYDRLEPGEYLVEITSCDEQPGRVHGEPPTWVVTFSALEGASRGGEIRDWLKWTKKAMPRLRKLLSACGQLQDGPATYKADDLVGRVLRIVVVEDTYQGQTRARVAFAGFMAATPEELKEHGDDLPF